MTAESWEEVEIKYPLMRFSFYLNGRVELLKDLQQKILEDLNSAWIDNMCYHEHIDRAEGRLWFWILGAYEVIRTMDQAKTCFAPRLHDELKKLKQALAEVRMPAAKMEKKGKNTPISSNRSASGIDSKNQDLLLGGPDLDKSARILLDSFENFFSSITQKDVLKSHESSYPSPSESPGE